MNKSFNKFQIVWAKIKGYPWWPGEVKLNYIIYRLWILKVIIK